MPYFFFNGRNIMEVNTTISNPIRQPNVTDAKRKIGASTNEAVLGCTMIINSATKATLAIFITLNKRQTMIVKIIPTIIEYAESSQIYRINNATAEPIRFDFDRSIESFLVSFSSGDITKIIDNNVQNNS